MNTQREAVLATLRADLSASRAEELALIQARLHDPQASGTVAPLHQQGDCGDAAGADLINDTHIALLNRECTKLDLIEAALLRLDGPLAGLCTTCGEAIAVERLQANPLAHTCRTCQQEIESRPGKHVHHSI